MAKTFYVSPGRSYTVTASEGTTITYPGITKPAATVGSEGSVTFNCTGTEIVVSDDNAKIAQNFNNAGAAVAGAGGGSGSTEGVALLEGGNSFSGDQTITGDVTIDGAVTISGDVTAEGEYNGAEVIETQDTTITPEVGKYYKYTGTGDTITIVAPVWNGYMTISYLETAEPVELEGVTWSPAKPSMTGAGPFVYTLVCAESGKVLASVMNYSVATAEAIKGVVPIDCRNDRVIIGSGASSQNTAVAIGARAAAKYGVAVGYNAKAHQLSDTAIGMNTSAYNNCVALGQGASASTKGTAIGCASDATSGCIAIGENAKAADVGTAVFRLVKGWTSDTITQIYIAAAGSPLANTYENGEAMMGYVVTDAQKNIMTDAEGNAMVGTQKLSVLFPNNRGENAFTPAMLSMDEDWTPKLMFRPSDLDLPDIEIDEPIEPEEYQPLPVYPIVEPEIEEPSEEL